MLNQLYFYIFSKTLHARYITEGTIELISEGFTSCTNETIQLFSEKKKFQCIFFMNQDTSLTVFDLRNEDGS